MSANGDRKALLEHYGQLYARHGFAVVWTVGLTGADAKKVTTKAWQTTQPLRDPEFAAGLFATKGLKRNPGITARTSGLVVVDCDWVEGLREIESLGLPETWIVRSSGDKRHLYFRQPAVAQLPYVGFRFEEDGFRADENRYLICPPAIHPASGNAYEFLVGPDIEIAAMPPDVYAELARRSTREEAQRRERVAVEPGAKFRAGARGDALFRFACQQRRWYGEDHQAILEAALAYNERMCDPPIERERVESQVAGAMNKDGGQELAQATVARETEPRALDEVVETFQRHLHLPDPTPIYVTLATAIANRILEGDPVWLVIVAGSSRGKTELLLSLDGLEGVRVVGALTVAALLSGTARKDKSKDATGGVLAELGEQGLVVVKDFGAILSLQRDTRAQVLQALRDVYDGRYTRDVGADGGRKLEWIGRVGLLAGATSALDQAHAVLSVLGERWLTLRLPQGEETTMARLTMRGVDTAAMRAELRDAAHGFLDTVPPPRLRLLTPAEEDLLASLAVLVCFARSPVERERDYKREIVLVHQPEGPGRITRQLHKLYVALEAIGVDAAATLVKVGLDSIPSPRREVLLHMLDLGEERSTSRVARRVGLPTVSAARALEELAAHGLLTVRKDGDAENAPNMWKVSDEARGYWEHVEPQMRKPHE